MSGVPVRLGFTRRTARARLVRCLHSYTLCPKDRIPRQIYDVAAVVSGGDYLLLAVSRCNPGETGAHLHVRPKAPSCDVFHAPQVSTALHALEKDGNNVANLL